MESFTERNGGLGSTGLIQEQTEAEFSRKDTYMAPAAIGSDENLKARICKLEPDTNREEKEIVTVKAGVSEEIKRADPEFSTTEILLKAKETARRSNRRRKIRVYLP